MTRTKMLPRVIRVSHTRVFCQLSHSSLKSRTTRRLPFRTSRCQCSSTEKNWILDSKRLKILLTKRGDKRQTNMSNVTKFSRLTSPPMQHPNFIYFFLKQTKPFISEDEQLDQERDGVLLTRARLPADPGVSLVGTQGKGS